MFTHILSTKLAIPQIRPDHVSRPGLVKRLDTGLCRKGKLSLIAAPAGYGKTTLMAAWARELMAQDGADLRVAWLSLDEGDNDPVRFWSYVISAIREAAPELADRALPALDSPESLAVQSMLITMMNEIAVVDVKIILCLDDYHVITAPSVHEGIAFLLTHQPANLHVALATRADPPLPVSQLRALGQVAELRAADLRFTPAEATSFLQETAGLDLTPEEIEILEARTEGWAAGLQLAGLAMSGHVDQGAFLAEFAGDDRYIADYLVEDVLHREPPNIQAFLLETSILERLCAPLCDAVTGRADGREVLNTLEKANLFLIPLDRHRTWFRYHQLFADLLRQRLRERRGEQVPDLHSRASRWYASQDMTEEAIHHAMVAGEVERAGELVERIVLDLITRGNLATVSGWIEALPAHVLDRRPLLRLAQAWLYNLTRRIDEIEPALQSAERALASGETATAETKHDLHGQIATLRAYAAWRANDIPETIRLLQLAQDQLAVNNLRVRTAVNLTLGRAYIRKWRLEEAAAAFERAYDIGTPSDNELAGSAAGALQAMVMVGQGKLNPAADLCRTRIETLQAANGEDIPALCHLYNTLGYVLYLWNRREEAVDALTRGLLLSLRIGYGPYGNAVRISTALLERLRQLAAEEGRSIPLPSQAEAVIAAHPSDLKVVDLLGWRVGLWLNHGEIDIATRWAEAYAMGIAPPGPWPVYGDLALARVWLAQGKIRAALERVHRTQEKAQAAGAIGWQITTGPLKATLYQALGEESAALDALGKALTLAEPEGWIRVFADEGAALAPLLHRLIAQGKTGRLGREILAAIPRSPEEPVQVAESSPLLDPLTPRELEVLRLLPTELSHAEIGDALFIARSTVRSHVKQIYAKLDVSDRTQAVLRAQKLGLL